MNQPTGPAKTTVLSFDSKLAFVCRHILGEHFDNIDLQSLFCEIRLKAWKKVIEILDKYKYPNPATHEWYGCAAVATPPADLVLTYLALPQDGKQEKTNWKMRFFAHQIQGFLQHALNQPDLPVPAPRILADFICLQTIGIDRLPTLVISDEAMALSRITLSINGNAIKLSVGNNEEVQNIIRLLEAKAAQYDTERVDNVALKAQLACANEQLANNSGELKTSQEPFVSLIMFDQKCKLYLKDLTKALTMDFSKKRERIAVKKTADRIVSVLQQVVDFLLSKEIDVTKVYTPDQIQEKLRGLTDAIKTVCHGDIRHNLSNISLWYRTIVTLFVKEFLYPGVPQLLQWIIADQILIARGVIESCYFRAQSAQYERVEELILPLVKERGFYQVFAVYFLANEPVLLETSNAGQRFDLLIARSSYKHNYVQFLKGLPLRAWQNITQTDHDYLSLVKWMFDMAWLNDGITDNIFKNRQLFFESMLKELMLWPAIKDEWFQNFNVHSFLDLDGELEDQAQASLPCDADKIGQNEILLPESVSDVSPVLQKAAEAQNYSVVDDPRAMVATEYLDENNEPLSSLVPHVSNQSTPLTSFMTVKMETPDIGQLKVAFDNKNKEVDTSKVSKLAPVDNEDFDPYRTNQSDTPDEIKKMISVEEFAVDSPVEISNDLIVIETEFNRADFEDGDPTALLPNYEVSAGVDNFESEEVTKVIQVKK